MAVFVIDGFDAFLIAGVICVALIILALFSELDQLLPLSLIRAIPVCLQSLVGSFASLFLIAVAWWVFHETSPVLIGEPVASPFVAFQVNRSVTSRRPGRFLWKTEVLLFLEPGTLHTDRSNQRVLGTNRRQSSTSSWFLGLRLRLLLPPRGRP